MKGRFYHVQDPAEVKYTGLDYSVVGFESGDHNGLIKFSTLQLSGEQGILKVSERRRCGAYRARARRALRRWSWPGSAASRPRFSRDMLIRAPPANCGEYLTLTAHLAGTTGRS